MAPITNSYVAMIKHLAFTILTGCSCSLLSCVEAQPSSPEKVLIVYLSRTGNTKAVAEMIQHQMGGDLVELELQKPYPADYQTTVDQVAHENETGYLPPLKTRIDSVDRYNVIFIGFPTWGMQLPPPVKSFLKQYDLKGKTIVPFNTNAGYGIGSSFQSVQQLCTGCNVLEGFSTQGGKEKDGIMFVMKNGRALEVEAEVKEWLLGIAVFAQKSDAMKNTTTSDETAVLAVSRQLTQWMIERDTAALGKILDKDFTLTHITGYVQSRAEWLAEIEEESMKYHTAEEVSHSLKIDGDKAEFVQKNLLDARIWGSRNTWRLQQKLQLENRDGNWIILKSVASTF